ncbi:type I-C CRISPR-associated protein Cas7/Csd2 [uncultured Flavonifractor sp.]|uniref:type I-C CRISPR-associated protein Cas7/Csd2 n=1 Tax=uncultured Flavonifractor sp. TaxID=1193534 RepID=UPI00174C236B|nr:type I-C CRISPR-associated protein Cas7/Csd2 [uncultured Flavonifractor sp.]
MAIQNRYEFMYYVSCTNANPNGDPDMGNTPRLDPQTMQGFITDVATKRRIRNYIQMAFEGQPGMNIIVQQATNLNRHIAEAKRAAGVEDCAKEKSAVYAGRKKACELFYDVRTFGAVMSTGPNAGQVRGPVQITFGKSLDPILPLDISITRMAVADTIKDGKVEDYLKKEEETPEDKLRTMGRKQLIPFGLYEVRGFISANLAAETGFDDADLKALFEAILNMYEHDHSASKGEMSVVSPLVIFKHVGTDSDEMQRARQAKLGCAPAHKLFELVHAKKKADVPVPRSYRDYDVTVDLEHVPAGVEIGFQRDPYGPITWGKLPQGEDWFRLG